MENLTYLDMIPISKPDNSLVAKRLLNNLSTKVLDIIFEENKEYLCELIGRSSTEDECVETFCDIRSFFYYSDNFSEIDAYFRSALNESIADH